MVDRERIVVALGKYYLLLVMFASLAEKIYVISICMRFITCQSLGLGLAQTRQLNGGSRSVLWILVNQFFFVPLQLSV